MLNTVRQQVFDELGGADYIRWNMRKITREKWKAILKKTRV
jgi:hypothetical protein